MVGNITSSSFPPAFPHHLLGQEGNHIPRLKSVLITQVVPTLNCVISNLFQAPRRREAQSPHTRRRNQAHTGVLRARSNTSSSSIHLVNLWSTSARVEDQTRSWHFKATLYDITIPDPHDPVNHLVLPSVFVTGLHTVRLLYYYYL